MQLTINKHGLYICSIEYGVKKGHKDTAFFLLQHEGLTPAIDMRSSYCYAKVEGLNGDGVIYPEFTALLLRTTATSVADFKDMTIDHIYKEEAGPKINTKGNPSITFRNEDIGYLCIPITYYLTRGKYFLGKVNYADKFIRSAFTEGLIEAITLSREALEQQSYERMLASFDVRVLEIEKAAQSLREEKDRICYFIEKNNAKLTKAPV